MRLWHQCVLLCALPLAACRLGPDYRVPALPAGAEGPLTAIDPSAALPAEPPDDWWKLYNDSRLDRLLAAAFAANQDLNAAQANLSAATALLRAARAGRYPATTVGAAAIYGRDATTDEILELGGHPPETLATLDDVAEVSYEIDLFGRVRRSIEAARASAASIAAARDQLRVTIAAETARAYAQICALGEQLAVARHSLDVVSRESDITARREEAGAGSHFDVVRAQGLVAQVRSAIPPLEGQRRAALFELTALLGRAPANAPTEVDACAAPPQLASLIPVGDGAALIKRRPDVRQAERSLAAATARIGVAAADLYPKVNLLGIYGGTGFHGSDLIAERGLTWGIGPSVTWSFPNQAGARARIRQARANTAAALARFDAVVLTALKETEQALASYSAELGRKQALTEAQDRTRLAYTMAHDQFLAGSGTDLDLLTAEQALVTAESAAAASDAGLIQDQIAVFKALGGGWRRIQ